MSFFFKSAGIVIALALTIFIAGITGLLFQLWPTWWPDQSLRFGEKKISFLVRLRSEPKFTEAPELYYPGAADEATRIRAETLINELINELVSGLPAAPRKSFALSAFKRTLAVANDFDTEDQERLGLYLQQIMDVLGIASSNELLNVWRLGFPYGWVIDNPRGI